MTRPVSKPNVETTRRVMDRYKGKVAIVTGGASGIGRALCEALAARGATVIVADINLEGAECAAAGLRQAGGCAQAARVDVTQAEAVQALVSDAKGQHGRLDYIFNNAGLGLAGEVRDMDLAHWRDFLDVNLWGVIHGTTAAYQVMVEQGFGHIVNTASGVGLFPAAAMAAAYTTTKYAVVGLSTALRPEAAGLGVKVSVACPAVVRTGLLDSMIYVNVKPERVQAAMTALGPMPAAKCARAILKGVARNQAIIPIGFFARAGWWLYRLSPGLFDWAAVKIASEARATVRAT